MRMRAVLIAKGVHSGSALLARAEAHPGGASVCELVNSRSFCIARGLLLINSAEIRTLSVHYLAICFRPVLLFDSKVTFRQRLTDRGSVMPTEICRTHNLAIPHSPTTY
jgi:hypothetical protein